MGTIFLADTIYGKRPNTVHSEEMVRKIGIECLYYITHIDNVKSILHNGILSHSEISRSDLQPSVIYNQQVIDRRGSKTLPNGKRLWDYANLYFQPRNAMLYSLVCKYQNTGKDLVILSVKKTIIDSKHGVFITDGNAANHETEFYALGDLNESAKQDLFKRLRKQIDNDWWNREDGSKRKIMAECLIPKKVAPSYIQGVYVACDTIKQRVNDIINSSDTLTARKITVAIEPKMFFRPDSRSRIGKKISLVNGDLFFSRMQTLTISVNCVGVMGAGLASTAKYRFPDMYVKYQDLCKHKKLAYGSLYVYKRESSVFADLADEYVPLEDIESASQTWFLLFPTKEHWRNKSDIDGIERGLQWLVDNYKAQGIESLAIPALGCGKGGLTWDVVGPLMCKYLIQMDIDVAIYLPAEKNIPNSQTTPDFLLSAVDF